MECFLALVVWSRSIKTFCFDREQMDGMEDEKKSVEIYVERLTTWIRRDCLQWQNPTKLYAGCSDISPCWHHELFTLLCTRYCLLLKALLPTCSTKNLNEIKALQNLSSLQLLQNLIDAKFDIHYESKILKNLSMPYTRLLREYVYWESRSRMRLLKEIFESWEWEWEF